jgi:hypothetical protein
MLKVLLNIAIIVSLTGQLLMPSFAVSNEMTELDMQSSSVHQSTMMESDCDSHGDSNHSCCIDDISQCISHCHAVANLFVLFLGSDLTATLLTSAKISPPLWISTPVTIASQNPPPIA